MNGLKLKKYWKWWSPERQNPPKNVKWQWCSGTHILDNLWKWYAPERKFRAENGGSLARHIPNMHTYGSTAPPPPSGRVPQSCVSPRSSDGLLYFDFRSAESSFHCWLSRAKSGAEQNVRLALVVSISLCKVKGTSGTMGRHGPLADTYVRRHDTRKIQGIYVPGERVMFLHRSSVLFAKLRLKHKTIYQTLTV